MKLKIHSEIINKRRKKKKKCIVFVLIVFLILLYLFIFNFGRLGPHTATAEHNMLPFSDIIYYVVYYYC